MASPDFFKDSFPFIHVHHDQSKLFGDSEAANLLVIRTALSRAIMASLQEFNSIKKYTVYVPEDDCGSWNFEYYPEILLPRNSSVEIIIRKGTYIPLKNLPKRPKLF